MNVVNPPSITTTFTYRIPGPVVVRDTMYVECHTELHSVTVTYCDGVEVDWDAEGWHLTGTGEHRGNRRRCFPPHEVIDPYLVDARQRMASTTTAAYGAGDVVADAIGRHVRRCEHPWCREQS
jgi:hypothetical protein